MGIWSDLFGGGTDQPYPTAPTGGGAPSCGDQPYAAPEPDGFFNKLFAPKQLLYPLRGCDTKQLTPVQQPPIMTIATVSAPSTSAPVASTPPSTSAPTAPSPATAGAVSASDPSSASAVAPAPVAAVPSAGSPVTVVIALPGMTGTPAVATTSAPSAGTVASDQTPAASSGSALAPAPVPAAPAPVPVATTILAPQAPASKLRRAFVFNPEFAAQFPSAHEELIEEMTGERCAARLVTKDATPVAFVVPDGCDSLDLLYSPVEVNPGCGCDSDLDQLVTVGEAKLSANIGGVDSLTPGQQVIVTVPWRAASFVDLGANRLRMQVLAHFYKAEAPELSPTT